jgi:chromosome segregation ATPase
MGTYGLDGVIKAWEQEQLTTEQAIGQILLLLQELQERIRSLEQRLERYIGRMRRSG